MIYKELEAVKIYQNKPFVSFNKISEQNDFSTDYNKSQGKQE